MVSCLWTLGKVDGGDAEEASEFSSFIGSEYEIHKAYKSMRTLRTNRKKAETDISSFSKAFAFDEVNPSYDFLLEAFDEEVGPNVASIRGNCLCLIE